MSVRRSSRVFAALAKLPIARSCAAVTCTATLTPGRIFCQDHWFSLPKWLRAAIINTFRDAEWDAHQDAISQAADHIDAAFVAGTEHVVAIASDGSFIDYEGTRL